MKTSVKISIILLFITNQSYGNWFTDAVSWVSGAANTVADGVKDAGNWVADRFRDTKVTRAIDYGARKAALESSLAVANAVLESTRFLSEQTLNGAYYTAQGGVIAAEQFLDKVVKNAAVGVLKGPAEVAKGVLEGAKQSTVGVLEGSRWLVNNTLGQIDINCVHYDGDLQNLVRLNLGNVLVQGKLIQPFEVQMQLDLSDPVSSVSSFAKSLGKMMESAFLTPQKNKIEQTAKVPLDQAFNQIEEAAMQASLAQKNIDDLKTPQEVINAQKTTQEAKMIVAQEQNKISLIAADARKTIFQAGTASYDDLIKYISARGIQQDRATQLFKQELFRRRQALVAQAAESAPPATNQ